METHKLREVFKPNMSEVAMYFYQLEKLIEVCTHLWWPAMLQCTATCPTRCCAVAAIHSVM